MKRITLLLTMLSIVAFSWLGSAQTTLYLTTSGGSYPTEKWVDITTGPNSTGTVLWAQGNGTYGDSPGFVTDASFTITDGITYYINAYDKYDDGWDGTKYQIRTATAGGGTLIVNNGDISPNDGNDDDATFAFGDTQAQELEVSESFSYTPPACPDVTGLTADNFTAPDQADISWIAAAGVVTYNWEIQLQGVAQGDAGVIDQGTTTDPVVTDTATLVDDTSYTLYVQSDCGGGALGNYISLDFTFIVTTPLCVTLNTPVDAAVDQYSNVVFTWTPNTAGNSATAGYHVFLGNSATTMTDIGTIAGTSATITGLVLGQTYFWTINPENAVGITDCSAGPYSFTLISPPAVPVGVTCTGTNSPTVIFSEELDTQGTWTGDITTGTNGTWRFGASTVSNGTGATAPQSGSAFMYYEASGDTVATASAVSPVFDMTTANEGAELSFYLHAFGAGIGTFEVGAATTAAGPFTNLLTWHGPIQSAQADVFIPVGLDVSAYIGGDLFIEFKHTGINNFTGDLSVDLLEITSCDIINTFPFTEDFEDTSTTRDYWSQIQETGTKDWTFATGSSGGAINTAHGGTKNARFTSSSSGGATKLVSPTFDLTGVLNPELNFWYGQEYWSPDQNETKVYYSVDAGTTWVEIAHYTESIDVWTEVTLQLPNPSATYQIAFEGTDNYGRANVIDDVTVGPQCTGSTVTWDETSGTWLGGIPDATTPVVIPSDTSNGTGSDMGSFTACTCQIDAGGFVEINTGDYIKVINDLTNNGSLLVYDGASFVQVRDYATVTGASANFDVEVKTVSLVDTGRYTYFSSPTQGETLATFDWSMTNRIWKFNEVTQAWVLAPTTETMIPGKGYIVRPDPGQAFPYIGVTDFTGPFNTGVIAKNIIYNAGGTDDDNALVGNPYPSAIDTDMLLTSNPRANAFYFWTHESAANGAGEFTSNDDYAVWNNSGGASGNATAPAPTYIASGQGFFATANGNSGALELKFSNAMRVTDNNNNFLRPASGNLDKIWLNLTTDVNLNSQILIAFNPLCSDAYDAQFDAERLSFAYVSMSSQGIGNDVDNLAIQTRGELTNEDTIIPLRINITDDSIVNYTISIDHFENLTNENVYLRDNLLNTLHNLKVSEYNFTLSEAGINDTRFELVFSRGALSVNDNLISSDDLFISSIDATNFKVVMRNNLVITNFKAFDILGKLIIDINPNQSSFNVNTSIKEGTILVTKSTLENGQVVSKKFIKL